MTQEFAKGAYPPDDGARAGGGSPHAERPPTVRVGGWMTKCLVCNENVIDGSDNTHKVAGGGWAMDPHRPGCGAVWTHVEADYPDHKERVMEMYPGLLWAGFEVPRG